ncbi:cytochrome b [Parvibaculum indicum]|uniref:cytochrome b/b6 domain-containing protein n=1 Tax=Parvibaculum indicum TaxID=562969 RepID=UPI00142043E5|nr:cytochrome b/b6 domain-containing protein [Parvibaculum indicum]NIJ40797.1 cytochrome b [Parvibaculum indicum]
MSETSSPAMVKVWDPFVRLFHWTLATGFIVAYLTEGEPEWLHITAGFTVAGLVAARIVWGFIGPEHARFSDFVYSPGKVFGYLRDLITFRAKRYVGHSPAGGAMVIALLLSLAGTTGTGAFMYFSHDEGGGEQSFIIPEEAIRAAEGMIVTPAYADEDEYGEEREGREHQENPLEEVHEFFANLALFLVILHLGGVALASFAHKENLPQAMVTGEKRS